MFNHEGLVRSKLYSMTDLLKFNPTGSVALTKPLVLLGPIGYMQLHGSSR